MKYFVLKPSLEHMALVKIAVSLWNQNDARTLILENSFPLQFFNRNEKWKNIEKRVIEKVPHLSLPQLLKEKLSCFIKPIGIEVLKWIEYHHKYFHIKLPAEFCWTPQGTINRKRTAEVLVKDDNLDMITRYKLARIYCLENDTLEIWNSMTEDHKASFLKEGDSKIVWFHNLMINAQISYKDKFLPCAVLGYKSAAEYFLQKLTAREKEECLLNAAKYITNGDVLCFFLLEMDENQQIEVFKNAPFIILHCFLQWPLQSFFIEIANCVWDFLSKQDYDFLLRDIIQKAAEGFKDWDYQNLFREFWQESPHVLKNFITDKLDNKCLLRILFHVKDKANFRLILKDATLATKKRLIYNEKNIFFFHFSVRDNEWDFLEFYIRECLPSKNDMLKFKEEFEDHIIGPYINDNLARRKWNQLFHFSDESIFKCHKRSAEKAESSSSKRFHT